MSTVQAMTILIADSFQSVGVQSLEALGCVVVHDASLKENALVESIQEVNPDVLVVRSTKVTAEMMHASTQLSMIIRAGAGYDTIDIQTASDSGIFVSNCPGKNSIAVAELAWGLILSCDRRIPDQVLDLRNGAWRKKEYAAASGLFGRTLGVVGLGGIGKEVINRAQAFGMHVIAWSRSLTEAQAQSLGIEHCADLLSLASQSDAVSVHVASTNETANMINEAFFSAMQDGSIFVNTSRGQVVDEVALANAVEQKNLKVGLDVFVDEPSSGDASFSPEVVSKDYVYGTHHVGASTKQAQEAIAEEAVRIAGCYVEDGTVLNCINRATSTPAKALMSVRHKNLPGVLSHVFEIISHAGVNVEEMENMMYDGAHAACARIQLDVMPSKEQIKTIESNENILSITITPMNEGT